jgi:glutathione S-transferase
LYGGAKRIRIGYWKCWGRGEFVRLMLNYLKLDYEEVMYATEEDWDKDKKYLPTPFPSLPYIQDGKYFLTDFVAILEYLTARYAPRMGG